MMYEPETDPLEGLNPYKPDDLIEILQIVWDYMVMWRDDESYRDINKIIESGDDEMLADYLVGAGAIQSDGCVPTCSRIERVIEGLAERYRALSQRTQAKRMAAAFNGCTVYVCSACNHHEFVNAEDCVTHEDMMDMPCAGCAREGTQSFHKWDK